MPEPITAEYLESKVADVNMTVVEGRLTIAVLRLHSGFLVTGESVVHDAENFDEEAGARVAYANAIEKLFTMEAYHRKCLPELVAKAIHAATAAHYDVSCEGFSRPWDELEDQERQRAIQDVHDFYSDPDEPPCSIPGKDDPAREIFKAICLAMLPKDAPPAAEPSPIAEAPAPQLILPI